MLDKAPDLSIFVESWVTAEKLNSFEIKDYTACHKIRTRKDKHHGGGLLVYIRDGISLQSIKHAPMEELEVLTLQIRPHLLPRSIPWFAFIIVYYPPGDKYFKELKLYIMDEVDRLLTINQNAQLFIVGDFNDLDTSFLHNLKNFKQLIKEPTRADQTLEKCFTNSTFNYNVEIFPPISNSDHNLIHLQPVQILPPQVNIKTIWTRPRREQNIKKMGKLLCDYDWSPLYQSNDVGFAAEFFHGMIYDLYINCFPIIEKKININSHNWINNDLRKLFVSRNIAFKNNQNHTCQLINIKIKKMVKESKQKWFEKLIEDQPIGSSQFHRTIKQTLNLGQKNKRIILQGKSIEESYSENFNYFSSLANSHKPLEDFIFNVTSLSAGIPLIEKRFVYDCLRRVDSSSSCAPDLIPNFIWNSFSVELTDPITSLINLSLINKTCPNIWKNTFLTLIPKSYPLITSSQLRPISVSSAIVKICEKHILSHIIPILIPKLDRYQFGGIPNRSTSQYLTIYMDKALTGLETRNNYINTIVTDFSKAYDNLDHNVFMEKLSCLLPHDSIVLWIYSFLKNRIQWLKNSDIIEMKNFKCANGVPQGSVLGGIIFAIITDDIARQFEGHLKFVDDMSIITVINQYNIDKPQQIVDVVSSQAKVIKMPLNPKKCCLLIHDFRKNKVHPDIVMENQILKEAEKVSILGIWIQSDLKWDYQVKSMITKSNSRLFILYRLKRLGANLKMLRIAYMTYIRPVLEYCVPVWSSSITIHHNQAIEGIQKRAIKIILGKNYLNYNQALDILKITSLESRRETLLYKFSLDFFRSFPHLLPEKRGAVTGRVSRSANKYSMPKVKTSRYSNSPIINMIRTLNKFEN